MWNIAGFEVPGLSKRDLKSLTDFVKQEGNEDVKAFAGALGGEKKFIEAARKYGLNHPATYKNKAKLNNAIKKFEKQTGITWPFK